MKDYGFQYYRRHIPLDSLIKNHRIYNHLLNFWNNHRGMNTHYLYIDSFPRFNMQKNNRHLIILFYSILVYDLFYFRRHIVLYQIFFYHHIRIYIYHIIGRNHICINISGLDIHNSLQFNSQKNSHHLKILYY